MASALRNARGTSGVKIDPATALVTGLGSE